MREVDPEELADLREVVAADIAHLATTWQEAMNPHTLRREAVLLRRLLIDNAGDIARLWRMEGREGQPKIHGGWDLGELPHWRGLALGTADQVDLGPELQMGGIMLWRQDAMDDEIRAAFEQPSGAGITPVRQYVEGICIVVQEKPIRRLDLITYVTNNRGGAHFDRKGKAGDPRRKAAHDLLDRMRREGFAISHQEAAFGQLIVIAQNVVRSPDVLSLIRQ